MIQSDCLTPRIKVAQCSESTRESQGDLDYRLDSVTLNKWINLLGLSSLFCKMRILSCFRSFSPLRFYGSMSDVAK